MTLMQFPADRRAAEVRRCAQALRTLHGQEANLFWRSEMALFSAELSAQGASVEEISHQASLFMNAVQLELQKEYVAAASGS
jgi:hypothetical protein